MNDRRYRFDEDLKENNEIYKSLEKGLKGIKENEYGLINKKITPAWIRCGSNYERFDSILERLVWNSIIDKNIEAIIIEIISKFDSQPLHKNVVDNGTGSFIKKDNTRNKDAKEKEGGNNTENLIFISNRNYTIFNFVGICMLIYAAFIPIYSVYHGFQIYHWCNFYSPSAIGCIIGGTVGSGIWWFVELVNPPELKPIDDILIINSILWPFLSILGPILLCDIEREN